MSGLDTKKLRRLLKQASPRPWSEDDGNIFSSPLRALRESILTEALRSGRPLSGTDDHPDTPCEPHSMGYLGTFPQDADNSDANTQAVAAIMSLADYLLDVADANVELRACVRRLAIHRRLLGETERWFCTECASSWDDGDREYHGSGCLAAPSGAP